MLEDFSVPSVVRLIVNPVSGSHLRGDLVGALAASLEKRGFAAEITRTARSGDATRLAREAVEAAAHAVIVVGGDGTVRETVVGLLGSHVPMLVAPAGTENLVARHFGFIAEAESLAAAIRRMNCIRIDVGRANGRPFVVIAGFGFDAEVVQRLHDARQGHITHMDYTGPIWHTFWRHRFPRIRVTADGDVISDTRGFVLISNVERYALGLKPVPGAIETDGLLDVCAYACRHQADLIGHTWRVICGRGLESSDVAHRRARHLKIETVPDTPVELDGDVAEALMSLDGRAASTSTPATASTDGNALPASVEFTVEPAALAICRPIQ
jgi:diacylglycerol kinase family enzyme